VGTKSEYQLYPERIIAARTRALSASLNYFAHS
jgi:hypothetical protein